MQHTFWIHCYWTDVLDRDSPATLPIQLCDIAEGKLDKDLIVAEMKNGIDNGGQNFEYHPASFKIDLLRG